MFSVPVVLLQWAVGGLFFLWVTTRRREVGLGYGWLMRGVFGLMAVGALATSTNVPAVIPLASGVVAGSSFFALVISILRRRSGVLHQREESQRRSARINEMTGIDRAEVTFDESAPEFPPVLDLIAPVIGFVAIIAAGLLGNGTNEPGSVLLAMRLVAGALLMGAASDAMLLGHWYLVQPGLQRDALKEMVSYLLWITPIEIALFLVPTGMLSAISGNIDDGYGGILTYFWVACAITTMGLAFVGKLALREKQYAAVMATTGLTYLSILTAFGTDLVARAILHT